MFHDHVRHAQKTGKLKGDCGQRRRPCWDCLRAAGLTPPYEVRDNYPRLAHRGQPVVMDGIRMFTSTDKKGNDMQVPEAERGDYMGQPRPRHRPKSDKADTKIKTAERAHLRAAIANREAI